MAFHLWMITSGPSQWIFWGYTQSHLPDRSYDTWVSIRCQQLCGRLHGNTANWVWEWSSWGLACKQISWVLGVKTGKAHKTPAQGETNICRAPQGCSCPEHRSCWAMHLSNPTALSHSCSCKYTSKLIDSPNWTSENCCLGLVGSLSGESRCFACLTRKSHIVGTNSWFLTHSSVCYQKLQGLPQ